MQGKKISRRRFLAGMGAPIAAAGVVAWQGNRAEAQGQAITLYTSRHYDTDRLLYEGFTRATGIRVNVVQAEAPNLLARLKSEGANSPADIFMTVDAANIGRAQAENLFQPVRSPILERRIPSAFRDPQGHWYSLTRRIRAIMYNRDRVRASELSTYADLADPKWRGRLISRSSSSVYNQSMLAAMITLQGEQATEAWARGIVANFKRPPQGNDTAQIMAVAAGEADLTFVNTYYLPRLMKSNQESDRQAAAKIGVFFPRPAHANISGAGILRTSRNRAAAQRFLEFLTSLEAQENFAAGNNEYPIVAGVPWAPELAAFGSFVSEAVTVADLARNNARAVQIADRAGWR